MQKIEFPWPFKLVDEFLLDTYEKINRIHTALIRSSWDILGDIRDAISGFVSTIVSSVSSVISAVKSWIDSAISTLWNRIKPAIDSISSYLSGLISSIASTLSSVWDWLKGIFGQLFSTLADWFTRTSSWIAEKTSWLWSTISSYLSGFWGWLKGKISEIWNGIVNWFSNLWNNLTKTFSQLWDFLSKSFSWLLSEFGKSFDAFIKAFVDPLLSWLKEIGKWLAEALVNFVNLLVASIQGIAGKIWEMAIGFATWLTDKVVGFFTDIINRIRGFFLPHSPPKELTESVIGLIEDFRKDLEKSIESIYHSPPSPEEVSGIIIETAGKAIALSTTGEVMGAVADTAHPTKQLQIREIIKGIFAYFGIERLIKTPLSVPYEIALLRPYQQIIESRFRTNIPDISTAREMLWRGIITQEKFLEVVAKHGFGGDYEKGFLELTKALPSIRDIITMMVRECFVPERFAELVQEYPPEATKFGAMWGFSEEWMQKYWAMHWVLPPLERVYEAYHRKLIDKDEVIKWIKYHDFEPKVREWLLKLSWDLPGRIDLRWMWEWGVINTDELKEFVIKTGIDPEYADKVVQGWLGMLLREERMKVVTAFTRAFVRGIISEDELKAKMKEMMITEDRLKLYVEAAKRELENEEKETLIKAILEAYRKGIIDKSTAISRLDMIIKNTAMRDALIELTETRMKIEKVVKEKETHFTMAQVGDLFRRKLITEEKARELWAKLGFADWEIELLVQRYAPPS